MKIITYYILLLVLIILVASFLLLGQNDTASMSMVKLATICVLLGVYVVGMSVVGEGKAKDEREINHRFIANRLGLLAGTLVLSAGLLYQLFVTHQLDYWLLAGLISINLIKLLSLIYLHFKR
jgi:uncharacterized membrane protein